MTMALDENFMMPQRDAEILVRKVFEHLADWPIRSAEAFRNVALGPDGAFAINPLLHIPDADGALYLRNTIRSTIAEGRMIDFGYIPNAMIKEESTRSRQLFEAGEFSHPYDAWLATTSWEGGYNGYHISPHPFEPKEILVLELYGISVPPNGPDVLLVYDIVSVEANPNNTLIRPLVMDRDETPHEIRERGANSLDPLVTLLRLLADASIPITRVDAPERLNRARAKLGKHQIPDHTVVHTHDYVTHFTKLKSEQASAYKGGHHASPVSHWRKAHMRQLSDGRIVPVKSSKVNWRETDELHRLFYKVD